MHYYYLLLDKVAFFAAQQIIPTCYIPYYSDNGHTHTTRLNLWYQFLPQYL